MKTMANSNPAEVRAQDFRLPEETHIGYVRLQVSNLERSLHFYESLMGMKRVRTAGTSCILSASGTSPYHILLSELPGALPKPTRSSGLYHVAYRFPHRRELAKVFHRMYTRNAVFQGFSDHLVSEAIYLADPDENGVELYSDRPRAEWTRRDDQIEMATQPLDLDNLVAELGDSKAGETDIDPNSDVGHVHLHVSDLKTSEEFYHGLLGFDVTQRSYPGALFLSAGGYHHHIGVNVWAGRGVPPPPPEAAGLLAVGIDVPDQKTIETLAQRFRDAGIDYTIRKDELLGTDLLRVLSPDKLPIEFFTNSEK